MGVDVLETDGTFLSTIKRTRQGPVFGKRGFVAGMRTLTGGIDEALELRMSHKLVADLFSRTCITAFRRVILLEKAGTFHSIS